MPEPADELLLSFPGREEADACSESAPEELELPDDEPDPEELDELPELLPASPEELPEEELLESSGSLTPSRKETVRLLLTTRLSL